MTARTAHLSKKFPWLINQQSIFTLLLFSVRDELYGSQDSEYNKNFFFLDKGNFIDFKRLHQSNTII